MKNKRVVGYSFWGFLGDRKFDANGNEVSTPDGNAFYSWCIIRELVKRGYKVCSMMPKRDSVGAKKLGMELFGSWAKFGRLTSYVGLVPTVTEEQALMLSISSIHNLWKSNGLDKCEFILHEWRMRIPGRNDELTRINHTEAWQPDLFLQDCLIAFCKKNNVKLIVFDLDYKLTESDFEGIKEIARVIELGDKWSSTKFKDLCKRVYIPFDFSFIDEFEVKMECDTSLVYVGNRYERDWCIDKYIPESLEDCVVYGNWKEGGRDSEDRWPNIKFGKRLQTSEMHDVYSNSVATVLLAKKEYCDHHFMTARLIESVFYGTVPFFISEYGMETICEYAGIYSQFLTVESKADLAFRIQFLRNNMKVRKAIIEYLRINLRKMDCKFFVDDLIKIAR